MLIDLMYWSCMLRRFFCIVWHDPIESERNCKWLMTKIDWFHALSWAKTPLIVALTCDLYVWRHQKVTVSLAKWFILASQIPDHDRSFTVLMLPAIEWKRFFVLFIFSPSCSPRLSSTNVKVVEIGHQILLSGVIPSQVRQPKSSFCSPHLRKRSTSDTVVLFCLVVPKPSSSAEDTERTTPSFGNRWLLQ